MTTATDQTDRAEARFHPPLYVQRSTTLLERIQRYQCKSVIDAGCSEGTLLAFILSSRLQHGALERAVAIDICPASLNTARGHLPSPPLGTEYLRPLRIDLLQGDLTQPVPPGVLPPVDLVFSMEVLEHIPPHLVADYTHTLFTGLGREARYVILSTPNRDENGRFDTEVPPAPADWPPNRSVYSATARYPPRRHDGHHFELTRRQFDAYCDYIVRQYGTVWPTREYFGVGGDFSQGAVFFRSSAAMEEGYGEGYRQHFPFEAIFGMTETAYLEEFQPEPAPPMPLTTVCTKELPWEPFWSRLTSSVAASYARWAAERQGRPAHTPRRSTSRSGETGTIKTFGDFVSHYHLLEKDPFSASVAAVYDAVQQQCQLWTEEEERHLEAWRSAARPLHIPPDSAFQSTVTTHAGRVVPDSAAHQALHRLLPVKERSTAARAALNRLDEIVLCQTGERLLRWALQTLEREIVALGGQSLEESLRLLDRYGSGLTLSPEVRGVLLFISSVDVCPATLAFLKEANHSERIRVLSHPTNPQTSRRRTRAITKKSKLNSDTRREGGNTVVDILFRCPLL